MQWGWCHSSCHLACSLVVAQLSLLNSHAWLFCCICSRLPTKIRCLPVFVLERQLFLVERVSVEVTVEI